MSANHRTNDVSTSFSMFITHKVRINDSPANQLIGESMVNCGLSAPEPVSVPNQ
jgi:hypothetical protein